MKLNSLIDKELKMIKRGLLLAALAMLITYNLSYSQTVASKEAVTYFNEAVKAQKSRDYGTAHASYQKALLLFPSDMDYRKLIVNNLGIIFAEQGNFSTAESAFMEALRIDPDFEPAQFNLGLLYDMQPDKMKAMNYWMKVIELRKPKQFVIGETGNPEKKK